MNGRQTDALWRRLADAGLVRGEAPVVGESDSPWYVRTMLGCAGWLGALFLLGAVVAALSTTLTKFTGQVLVGASLCTGAVVLWHLAPRQLVLRQLALALSLAGQALLLVALVSEADLSVGLGWLAFAGVQALLFATNPDFLLRVWSAFAGTVALGVFAAEQQATAIAGALLLALAAQVWLGHRQWPRYTSTLRALGYGLGLGLVANVTAVDAIYREVRTLDVGRLQTPIASLGGALVGIVLLWTVDRLLQRDAIARASSLGVAALATAGVLALASVAAPGVGIGALLLWLGFAEDNRRLIGIGAVGLLAYLCVYYYLLDLTLLEKSAWLIGSGVALWVLRLVLLGRVPVVAPAGTEGGSTDA